MEGVLRLTCSVLITLALCICVPFTPSTGQPLKFELPKLPELPSPQELYKRLHDNFQQVQDKFNRVKEEFDELEAPVIDWDGVAEVKEMLQEYIETGPGNCDKIPHGKHTDVEVYMTTCQMVRYHGYPCEEYEVVTEDNYILGVQRIPHGKGQTPGARPVVFAQHGLLDSSTTWVSNLPNQSLGYILADAGYDVWLGNVRGNTYSRRHTFLDSKKDYEYWQFSWDEMAKYDLPAMINYALKISGQKKLHYIGHSQGTMIAFAKFSEDQELASKVEYFFALGPVSTVGALISPLRLLAPFSKNIKFMYYLLGGSGEFLPSSQIFKWLGVNVCQHPAGVLCENILFIIAGYDCTDLNVTRMPVYIAHTPAGTSVNNVVHFAQQVESKKFAAYDYGAKGNIKHYNQTTPPEYHPENLKIPVALYWGGKDWLADPTDVDFLIRKLKHINHNQFIPSFDHLDFVWGTSAYDLVYKDVIKVMKEHPIDVIATEHTTFHEGL